MTSSPLELQTDAEYIGFLTSEYGWEIEGPSYTAVPQPHQKYIGRNQREFNLIKHYLTGTYIIKDQFESNHNARHDFLEKIRATAPTVRDWIQPRSKLKKDRISTDIIMPMDAIVYDLEDTFPELSQRLRKYTSYLYDSILGYDTMPSDEKVRFVHRVDDVAYRFLEELVK